MLINRNTDRENSPVFRRVVRIGDMSNFSFNWEKEISDAESEVWRLSVASDHHTIAYLSLSFDKNFVKINLIEREDAKQASIFTNIGTTLISFACLRSVEAGFDGVVVFTAKNQLMPWYRKKTNAQRIGNSNRMVIFEQEAVDLINQYLS